MQSNREGGAAKGKWQSGSGKVKAEKRKRKWKWEHGLDIEQTVEKLEKQKNG